MNFIVADRRRHRTPILARNSFSRLRLALAHETFKEFLRPHQILLRIHANRVSRRISHIDRNAVFEQPKLLQALQFFQRRGRQRRKPLQRRLAIGINSQMLSISSESRRVSARVAVT